MKLKAPEGATGVSYEGDNYDVVDGKIDVPDDAAPILLSHGFIPLSDSDDATKEVFRAKREAKKPKAVAVDLPAVADAAPVPDAKLAEVAALSAEIVSLQTTMDGLGDPDQKAAFAAELADVQAKLAALSE